MKKTIKIIILSAIISLVVTVGWFFFEGYCAKEKERLPIYHTVYGGEWMGEQGLFWTVGITVPLTDADHPEPSTVDVSYSKGAVVAGFISFWIVSFLILSLGLKKNDRKKAWGTLAIIILIFACISGGTMLVQKAITENHRQTLIKARYKNANKLVTLNVSTAALNNENIVGINYPYKVIEFREGDANNGAHISDSSLDSQLIIKEISKNDLKKLIKYMEEIECDPTANSNGDFSYYCEVVYFDTEAKSQAIRISGSDGFPECWPQFSKLVNKICEKDILMKDPKLIVFSADWFKETFHVSDSDMPEGGTVEDMLQSMDIDMKDITTHSPIFSINKVITEYENYLNMEK